MAECEYTPVEIIPPDDPEFDCDCDSIQAAIEAKQNKLTPGANITIENDVISATGGGGSYSAGENIDITNNVISAPDVATKAELTSVEDKADQAQTDADTALAGVADLETSKQDTLTPGQNITIENNLISATSTEYSAGTNIDITGGVISAPNVYNKTEADTLLADKADADSVYSKTEADALLDEKADVTYVYTKTETDTLLDAKADATAVYTKTEADALLDAKADAADVYTKTEADALLADKQDVLTPGDGITIENGVISSEPDHVELTQAEYDTLTDEEKLNGTVYFITDGQGGGGGSYVLPTATATRLGGVKVGSGLSVEADGTLSAETTESDIFYITVDTANFTPATDPNVMEMELTSPYTLSELNTILQSENPKSMILRLVSTSGGTKTINEVLLNTQSPSSFEGDLLYTNTYMGVSHSFGKFTITTESGRTMLRQQAGEVATLPIGGAQGDVLVKQSAADYDVNWQTISTADKVKEMLLALVPPKSFADCTWDEAAMYLQWHREGLINLYDYWHVGDEKEIEMAAVETAIPAKHIKIKLVGTDQRQTADGQKSVFIWQQMLAIDAYPDSPSTGAVGASMGRIMDVYSTNGTYADSPQATWLNETYFNSYPEGMRNMCLNTKVYLRGSVPSQPSDTFTGKCMLPSEMEIFGTRTYSEFNNDSQLDYYMTASDKAFKQRYRASGSGAITETNVDGWLRSRPFNQPTSWTYNNQGYVNRAALTTTFALMPTGAF